ncbi:hypothetical protein [Thermodesulforhabdus norvegica]|uniref:Uncharacterized protein n=1 Tax=Thermodesulforhabdus norvegica TaxID=39841 RepID=A0A1I4TR81_9BACT|nr:hypothetical protein [Thermodesulforhabdus norvegica]SFM79282.1 hypothetical protein SAMN05660836_01475 [Thermodesulforhabdus norvegica]
MPAKCRVNVCGFDPALVRGYVKTGVRALWWYLPDEIFEEFKVESGDKVKGKLLAVYNADAEKKDVGGEAFEWPTSKETGLAVVLPSETIVEHQLTAFHFLELVIEAIVKADGSVVEVYPGEERMSSKWWPEERMKLTYKVPFAAP